MQIGYYCSRKMELHDDDDDSVAAVSVTKGFPQSASTLEAAGIGIVDELVIPLPPKNRKNRGSFMSLVTPDPVPVSDEATRRRSTFVTAEEALKDGDHNAISLYFIEQFHWKNTAPFFAEFFGTMMLTTVIGLTAGNDLAPLAIGGILMSMIFSYGHLSGGNYNPAVSMAVMIRGKIKPIVFCGYVASQLIGGICGAFIGRYTFDEHDESLQPDYNLTLPIPAVGKGKAFLLEFLFTYALCCAVLNTATTDSTRHNFFYGAAIASVVGSGTIATARYAGAMFNPAVACGLYAANAATEETADNASEVASKYLWLYCLASMLGGLVAGAMFHILNSDENSNIAFKDDIKEEAVGRQFRPSMAYMMSNRNLNIHED